MIQKTFKDLDIVIKETITSNKQEIYRNQESRAIQDQQKKTSRLMYRVEAFNHNNLQTKTQQFIQINQ